METGGANAGAPARYPIQSVTARPSGRRIMGYDNVHAVRPPRKGKFAGRRTVYDHRHRHAVDKGVPYEFVDAYQLLSDFFKEVDKVLKAHCKG